MKNLLFPFVFVLILVGITLSLQSCEKEECEPEVNVKLEGKWDFMIVKAEIGSSEEQAIIYESNTTFPALQVGELVLKDITLIDEGFYEGKTEIHNSSTGVFVEWRDALITISAGGDRLIVSISSGGNVSNNYYTATRVP